MGSSQGHRFQRARFSIELYEGRYVILDWGYGLIHAPGAGKREQAERALMFIWAYMARHGDVNLPRLPKRLSTPPKFPLGFRREKRPGWHKQQIAINRAFGRISELVRQYKLKDHELSTNADVIRAKRYAESMLQEALAEVGIGPS